MLYITVPSKPKEYQITFEDILNGLNTTFFAKQKEDTHSTRTFSKNHTPEKLLSYVNINNMINVLKAFNSKHATLIETKDKSILYNNFKIPKRSGGLRQINAPSGELMIALKELKYILEKNLYASYHTSAFAYVKGRSTIDAIKRHQKNNSRWFLKLDFHDFFGSSTPEFIMEQLKMIFPFNEILAIREGEEELSKALSICFLNNGLPQGSPISPTLTNLFMIPIDYSISKLAREAVPHLIYTRYADDIILSSDISFNWQNAQKMIMDTLKEFNAPFSLNTTKTRYGSSAGRNWNLGVMLNKDNQITIGHARKKAFKTMIYSFMTDVTKDITWSLEDVQHLLGLISYYKMVEGDAINSIINSYSKKFNRDVEQTLKEALHVSV